MNAHISKLISPTFGWFSHTQSHMLRDMYILFRFVMLYTYLQNIDMEAGYRVVIISGSGSETVIDIETEDDCSGDTCSYTFSSDDITDSYSVAVEVVACTTERRTCTNISSCELKYQNVCLAKVCTAELKATSFLFTSIIMCNSQPEYGWGYTVCDCVRLHV